MLALNQELLEGMPWNSLMLQPPASKAPPGQGEHLPDSQRVLASFLVVSQVTSLPAGLLHSFGQYCSSHACKCRQEIIEAFSVSKKFDMMASQHTLKWY